MRRLMLVFATVLLTVLAAAGPADATRYAACSYSQYTASTSPPTSGVSQYCSTALPGTEHRLWMRCHYPNGTAKYHYSVWRAQGSIIRMQCASGGVHSDYGTHYR